MKNLQAVVLLFLANTVSGIAQGISMIAIPWYFTTLDASATFGWIYWLITFSAFFWAPAAGTFVDKYSRKRIFLVLTFICGIIIAIISLKGYISGHIPIALAASVFAITFFNYTLHYPALYAFLQEITDPKDYGFITSAVEIQGQLASVLAGAGAALLLEGIPDGIISIFGNSIQLPFFIEKWELYEIFALDAMTYFVAFFLILFIRYKSQVTRQKETGKIFERLMIGFNYLKDNPYIFLFGVASYSIFVTVLLTTIYLLAIYVDVHLLESGDVYATAEMFYAFGAIFAGFAIRWLFRRFTTVTSVIIMTFITAALYVVLIFSRDEWILYSMLLLLGITNAGTRIQRVTYLFRHVPNQVYGRANSIFVLTNIGWRIFFLGIFALPFFHQDANVLYAMSIMSLFLVGAAAVMIAYYKKLVER